VEHQAGHRRRPKHWIIWNQAGMFCVFEPLGYFSMGLAV
jgi:hypothetical protein